MALPSPAVDAAFIHLAAALDTEATEFQTIGGVVFYRGTPLEARRVLELAGDRATLRDHIRYLHAQWQSDAQNFFSKLAVQPPTPKSEKVKNPPLSNIGGMSVKSAAKKIAVSEDEIVEWLEAGKLKGYRGVGGRWKITKVNLIKFYRKHHRLLPRAPVAPAHPPPPPVTL